MDFAVNVIVPAAQAFIMFSLGLGLELDDFKRVFTRRKAFLIGAVSQVLLLPLVAFVVVMSFDLSPALAAGIMILSFCPGGVSSNVLAKLSHGDLALSVSLTAVVSLLAFVTVPPLVTWSVLYFMGQNAPDFTITDIAVTTFLLTTVPVLIGILVRHVFTGLARRVERPLGTLAVTLWVLIVGGIFVAHRDLIIGLMPTLGPSLLTLPLALVVMGWLLGRLFRLDVREAKTVSIETGVQNSPLGIVLAGVIMGTTTGFSELALPSALYSVTMYIVTIPLMFLFRRLGRGEIRGAALQQSSS